MMKLLECTRILEKQKAAKIMYCQNRGLPIPTFDCAEDYCIPVEPVTAQQYAEIAHGRWVKAHRMMPPEYHHRKQCSVCGGWALQDYFWRECLSRYCPHCGTPMDGQAATAPTKSDRGCSTCANDGYDMPQCRECTEHPGYPWYKRKDGGAE